MLKKIPQEFINQLVASTDIVDLIGKRIALTRQGRHFKSHCPFHNENTPSFFVNKEKQFYYCFGCNAHGNAIDFLMNYDKHDFVSSLEALAFLQGVEIPREGNSAWFAHRQHSKIYELMEKISRFYQSKLEDSVGFHAREYLSTRGLNAKIIRKFSIGFAPPSWNSLSESFGKSNEDVSLLKKTGMVVIRENDHVYDRFRDRITFPIRNNQGKIVAFGGRTIKKDRAKYINSPETETFRKKNHLYGLYEAKRHCVNPTQVLLVEGYMDVVTLTQYGISYAVASLGSFASKEHIRLLYQSTDKIVCCYDGDSVGAKAAWLTLKVSLPFLNRRKQIFFMFLPFGEDPDTLIRKIGRKKFEAKVENPQSLLDFFFQFLSKKIDLSECNGKLKLSTLAVPLIERVSNKLLRFYLYRTLGQKIGIVDDFHLNRTLLARRKKHTQLQTLVKHNPMNTVCGLLVQNPNLCSLVPDPHGLEDIPHQRIEFFTRLVRVCRGKSVPTTGQLMEVYRESKFHSDVKTFARWNHNIRKDTVEITFIDTLKTLYDSILERRQEALINLERQNGLTMDEKRELWMLNQTLADKTNG